MSATLPSGRHVTHYRIGGTKTNPCILCPFLDSENDARGAKKGNKPRVLHNAIVVLLATYRYKHDTSKVER